MRRLTNSISPLATLTLLLAASTTHAQVKPPAIQQPSVQLGIDVLRELDFSNLPNTRVALVVNPASVAGDLRATVDLFVAASKRPNGPKLTALFGPEHGVYGDELAGDAVPNRVDPRTGIPAFSLYGKTKVPTAEMLQNVDSVVFDLQDLGARSYTYVTTLRNVLKGCAEHDKELIILDRPNPLGGNRIEGGLVRPGFESGVSFIPTPYLHGLTMGELAQLLRAADCPDFKKLTIIKMHGWTRDMTWSDTGLAWTPTSPHVPQAESVPAYVATGILGELYTVSIGVGYTLPFQVVGTPTPGAAKSNADLTQATDKPVDAKDAAPATAAPNPFFLPADTFAEKMNAFYPAATNPGITFQPVRFKPFYGTFEKTPCQGIQLRLDPHTPANLTEINFRLMKVLGAKALLQSAEKRQSMFDKVTGSDVMRKALLAGDSPDAVFTEWRKESSAFRESRKPFLLY